MRAKKFDRENNKIDLTFKLLEISGLDKNRQAHTITAEFYLMEEGSKPDNPSNVFAGEALVKWKDSTQEKNLNNWTLLNTNFVGSKEVNVGYSVMFAEKVRKEKSVNSHSSQM